jgi:hypothetical protein
MTRVKYESLTIDNKILQGISRKSEQLFKFFTDGDLQARLNKIDDREKRKVYDLALLAFLDSLGYSKRVVSSTHKQLFSKVLCRYEETVSDFLSNNGQYLKNIGNLKVLDEATATKIPLESNSVDGAITSPPYSFAIDYVKNDEAQLSFLGYNIDDIRSKMIGLIGRNKEERLENFFRKIAGGWPHWFF